jgi:hypothetical protein
VTDLEARQQFVIEPISFGETLKNEDLDDFFLPNSEWVSVHSRTYALFARSLIGTESAEPAPPYSTLMLLSMYRWDHPGEISAFLHRHPDTGAILESAYQAILAPFGCVEELTLQIVTDPSEPDDPELFVLIRTDDDPNTAREKLRAFEAEWLDAQPPATRRLVHFDVT